MAVAAIAVCTTLSACAKVIDGQPPSSGPTTGPTTTPTPTQPPVENAHLPVQGLASGSCSDVNATPLDAVCFDTIVQNALSDVMAFWTAEYPKISNGKS